MKNRFLAACCLTILGLACSPGPSSTDESVTGQATAGSGGQTHELELYVSPDAYDFSQNPKLLERILHSPFNYFRFVNRKFAQCVCTRFQDDLGSMPATNLHGDAHLEQYAVTSTSRGLTDFDDSSTGPPILDLIRFAVSVNLAADEEGWSDRKTELLQEFLRGYRAALKDPETEAPEPSVADRIRARFHQDRASWLDWAESLMQPHEFDPVSFREGIRLYTEQMLDQYPDLSPAYFRIKKAGRLRMGVGSALDEKFLFRAEGPTLDPADDLILEAKHVRDLKGIDCIQRRPDDAFAVLTAQSRIAYEPYQFLGYVHLDRRRAKGSEFGDELWTGATFWVYAWEDHYRELSTENSLQSWEELREVVFDVGVQLGRGHPKEIASPHDFQLRRALLQMVESFEPDIQRTVEELTDETYRAWKEFRAAAERSGVVGSQ